MRQLWEKEKLSDYSFSKQNEKVMIHQHIFEHTDIFLQFEALLSRTYKKIYNSCDYTFCMLNEAYCICMLYLLYCIILLLNTHIYSEVSLLLLHEFISCHPPAHNSLPPSLSHQIWSSLLSHWRGRSCHNHLDCRHRGGYQ